MTITGDVDDKTKGTTLNRLAREQTKHKLMRDIAVDLQVCKLEGIDPKEYLLELKQLIDGFIEKFKQEE